MRLIVAERVALDTEALIAIALATRLALPSERHFRS
jgi:hypothetical protein